MKLNEEMKYRPIFLIEPIKIDNKVDGIAYIPETSEIFVCLKDDHGNLKHEAYFFANCNKDEYNNLKNSENMYKYVKEYLYKNKDYNIDYIWG